jgi:hypothetical protein
MVAARIVVAAPPLITLGKLVVIGLSARMIVSLHFAMRLWGGHGRSL